MASHIVQYHLDHNLAINNYQLQIYLYYTQAYYLANHDTALFEEGIIRWTYLPAITSVFDNYRIFGNDSITQVQEEILIFDKERMEIRLEAFQEKMENMDQKRVTKVLKNFQGQTSPLAMIKKVQQERPFQQTRLEDYINLDALKKFHENEHHKFSYI